MVKGGALGVRLARPVVAGTFLSDGSSGAFSGSSIGTAEVAFWAAVEDPEQPAPMNAAKGRSA
jgi:hypothetical protein